MYQKAKHARLETEYEDVAGRYGYNRAFEVARAKHPLKSGIASGTMAIALTGMLVFAGPAMAADYVTVEDNYYEEAASGQGSKGGTWAWDGADNMKLDNYDGGAINAGGKLEVEVTGDNTISSVEEDEAGLYAEDLTITGSGSLTVDTADGISNEAIGAENLVIDGATVVTHSDPANWVEVEKDTYENHGDEGVHVADYDTESGSLTLKNGAALSVDSKTELYCEGELTVSDSELSVGQLSVKGLTAESSRIALSSPDEYGSYVDGDATFVKSTLNAKGGLSASGNIVFNDSDAYIEGEGGLHSDKTLKVIYSDVKVVGSEKYGSPVWAKEGIQLEREANGKIMDFKKLFGAEAEGYSVETSDKSNVVDLKRETSAKSSASGIVTAAKATASDAGKNAAALASALPATGDPYGMTLPALASAAALSLAAALGLRKRGKHAR